MRIEGGERLRDVLLARRAAMIEAWLARTLQTYPTETSGFLAHEPDPFRNPVGQTLKVALGALVDGVLGGSRPENLRVLLGEVIRIRAVQDFLPSEAVGFVFGLKQVIRDAVGRPGRGGQDAEWEALDARIDQLALLAFDLFSECREKLHAARVNEARRRAALLERMHGWDRGGASDPFGARDALP